MIQTVPCRALLCVFMAQLSLLHTQNLVTQPKTSSLIDTLCKKQPFTFMFSSTTTGTTEYDNLGYNYFALPLTTSECMSYNTKVFKNGSLEVTSYIVSDAGSGVIKASSASCFFTDTMFGSDPECNVEFLKRHYLFGDCSDSGSDKTTGDPIYGLSTLCTPLNCTCRKRVLSALKENGYGDKKYAFYDIKLPQQFIIRQPSTICANKIS